MVLPKVVHFNTSDLKKVKWPRHPNRQKGEKFADETFDSFDPSYVAPCDICDTCDICDNPNIGNYCTCRHPSKKPEFEKWVLLDVVTNFAVEHGRPDSQHHTYFRHHSPGYVDPNYSDPDHTNIRGHTMELTKPGEKVSFQRHRYLTAMAGPSFQNIQRLQRIEGSSDDDAYDNAANFVKGNPGTVVSALVPVIHPESKKPPSRKLDSDYHRCPNCKTRPNKPDSPECHNSTNFTVPDVFLWVDLTYPLRGIYLPIKLEASGTICVYAHFDFTTGGSYNLEAYTYNPQSTAVPPDFVSDEPDLPKAEKTRQDADQKSIKRATGWDKSTEKLGSDPNLGWGVHPKWTARFDVEALKRLVTAWPVPPKQLTDYVKLFDSKGILIRSGGYLDVRVDKAYNDPVHTMNKGQVAEHP